MAILPESGIAVSVKQNTDYLGIRVIVSNILDVLLGEEIPKYKPWLSHQLASIMVAKGSEAALQKYISVKETVEEQYQVHELDFKSIANLLENGEPQMASKWSEFTNKVFTI